MKRVYVVCGVGRCPVRLHRDAYSVTYDSPGPDSDEWILIDSAGRACKVVLASTEGNRSRYFVEKTMFRRWERAFEREFNEVVCLQSRA